MFNIIAMSMGYVVIVFMLGGLILFLLYLHDLFRFNSYTKRVREGFHILMTTTSEFILFAETYNQVDEMNTFIKKLYNMSHLSNRIFEQIKIYDSISDMHTYDKCSVSDYIGTLRRTYVVLNQSIYYSMKVFKCINTYKLINLSEHCSDTDKKIQCKNVVYDAIGYLDNISRIYSDHLGGDNFHYE